MAITTDYGGAAWAGCWCSGATLTWTGAATTGASNSIALMHHCAAGGTSTGGSPNLPGNGTTMTQMTSASAWDMRIWYKVNPSSGSGYCTVPWGGDGGGLGTFIAFKGVNTSAPIVQYSSWTLDTGGGSIVGTLNNVKASSAVVMFAYGGGNNACTSFNGATGFCNTGSDFSCWDDGDCADNAWRYGHAAYLLPGSHSGGTVSITMTLSGGDARYWIMYEIDAEPATGTGAMTNAGDNTTSGSSAADVLIVGAGATTLGDDTGGHEGDVEVAGHTAPLVIDDLPDFPVVMTQREMKVSWDANDWTLFLGSDLKPVPYTAAGQSQIRSSFGDASGRNSVWNNVTSYDNDVEVQAYYGPGETPTAMVWHRTYIGLHNISGSAADGYYLEHYDTGANTKIRLGRLDAGTHVQLAEMDSSGTDGRTAIRRQGDTLTAFHRLGGSSKDWASVEVNDSTYTGGGYTGFSLNATNNGWWLFGHDVQELISPYWDRDYHESATLRDDFNRADENPVAGIWHNAPSGWGSPAGGMIVSGSALTFPGGWNFYASETDDHAIDLADDFRIEFDIVKVNYYGLLIVYINAEDGGGTWGGNGNAYQFYLCGDKADTSGPLCFGMETPVYYDSAERWTYFGSETYYLPYTDVSDLVGTSIAIEKYQDAWSVWVKRSDTTNGKWRKAASGTLRSDDMDHSVGSLGLSGYGETTGDFTIDNVRWSTNVAQARPAPEGIGLVDDDIAGDTFVGYPTTGCAPSIGEADDDLTGSDADVLVRGWVNLPALTHEWGFSWGRKWKAGSWNAGDWTNFLGSDAKPTVPDDFMYSTADTTSRNEIYWNNETVGNDVEVHGRVRNTYGGTADWCRLYIGLHNISGSAADGYFVGYDLNDGSELSIYRLDNGTPTKIAGPFYPDTEGSGIWHLGLRRVGNTLWAFGYDSATDCLAISGSCTDSTYTDGGYVGLGLADDQPYPLTTKFMYLFDWVELPVPLLFGVDPPLVDDFNRANADPADGIWHGADADWAWFNDDLVVSGSTLTVNASWYNAGVHADDTAMDWSGQWRIEFDLPQFDDDSGVLLYVSTQNHDTFPSNAFPLCNWHFELWDSATDDNTYVFYHPVTGSSINNLEAFEGTIPYRLQGARVAFEFDGNYASFWFSQNGGADWIKGQTWRQWKYDGALGLETGGLALELDGSPGHVAIDNVRIAGAQPVSPPDPTVAGTLSEQRDTLLGGTYLPVQGVGSITLASDVPYYLGFTTPEGEIEFPAVYDDVGMIYGDPLEWKVLTLATDLPSGCVTAVFNETDVVDELNPSSYLTFLKPTGGSPEIVKIVGKGSPGSGELTLRRGALGTPDGSYATSDPVPHVAQDPVAGHLAILRTMVLAIQAYGGLLGLESALPSTCEPGEAYLCTDSSKLYYAVDTDTWLLINQSDHGALAGLGDDDHTQYHNDARADSWHDALSGDHVVSGSTHDHSDSPGGAIRVGLLDDRPGTPSADCQIYYCTDTADLYFGDSGSWVRAASVPAGTVLMFTTTCPAGWTELGDLQYTFLRGAPTDTWQDFVDDEAADHRHELIEPVHHTHDIAAVPVTVAGGDFHNHRSDELQGSGGYTAASRYYAYNEETKWTTTNNGHSHGATAVGYNTDNAGYGIAYTDFEPALPPYYTMRLCQKDA